VEPNFSLYRFISHNLLSFAGSHARPTGFFLKQKDVRDSGTFAIAGMVNVSPTAVHSVLATLAFPRIQSQQRHQGIQQPLASHSPEPIVSAIWTGTHAPIPRFLIIVVFSSVVTNFARLGPLLEPLHVALMMPVANEDAERHSLASRWRLRRNVHHRRLTRGRNVGSRRQSWCQRPCERREGHSIVDQSTPICHENICPFGVYSVLIFAILRDVVQTILQSSQTVDRPCTLLQIVSRFPS
jgi:hypothetical protein